MLYVLLCDGGNETSYSYSMTDLGVLALLAADVPYFESRCGSPKLVVDLAVVA
jgi:hypothetical protein